MHRHAYQGRKLSRSAALRLALVRGQITSLVLYEKITTTEAKAKTVAPQFDRLVTRAKRGNLSDRRELRNWVTSESAIQKLQRELLPAFESRSSGYTSITKLPARLGDNAPMAQLALVLDKKTSPAESESKADAAQTKTETKKPAAKKPATKKAEQKA